ncbi:putative Thiamine monophosphate synthase [Candidatus Terasakiella magnetica]|uniref:Putative Thiamine monophosphate synthase n=1 Tax=Candidatus Terasakiella magnetica TaxID=1867952 RepID=A0A1C3RGH9_9PROT|nr:thiamine phosphate synthase [Candidatus Terasakiella magnetica]SCA56371.1 putative Thiamine monophosphate synthase [Candidatus Terasakiella magnetica]
MVQTVSELALRLNRLNGKKAKLPCLIFMTDMERLLDPSSLIPQMPAQSALIIRHKIKSEKINLIKNNKTLCKKNKVILLVSDDVDLALNYGLDGVHFSQKKLQKIAQCGTFKKPKANFLISAACHNLSAINWANKVRADIALLSPVFKTKSHPKARSLGRWKFQHMARQSIAACYGLGGINKKTAHTLAATKACGFAGIGGLLD